MKKLPRAVFIVLLLSTLMFVGFIRPTVAEETIYIRSNGMVDPPTAPISTSADNITYYLTSNILGHIAVQRDNILLDGAGYTLQGAYNGTGIDLTERYNVTIKNLQIKAFAFGIRLYLSSKATISGNNITSNDYGIQLYDSPSSIISGNNITSNDYGIKLERSSSNIISGNNIKNLQRGIWLQGSPNNTLSGNKITNNNRGIYLEDSSGNTLSGNNITANNYDGIGLFGSSDNTLSGNNITANNYNGIWLYNSSSNIISGNNITSNDVGIQLLISSNNIIYNNNFVDNHSEQVYSAGSTNVWDNGYPSGGNYWSNYIDVDQYSGPYQNETGSDEIWDNPYLIDEYNVDNYPIVPEFPTKASTLFILIALTVAIVLHKKKSLNRHTFV